MSMTAVPISIRLVRVPTAVSSGNGDPSCLAKWCTRKYAPSAPSSSAATARSIDCSNASDADRVCEPGDDDQCPNDRKPIFFTSTSTPAAQAAFLADEVPALSCFLIPACPARSMDFHDHRNETAALRRSASGSERSARVHPRDISLVDWTCAVICHRPQSGPGGVLIRAMAGVMPSKMSGVIPSSPGAGRAASSRLLVP